MNLLRLARRVLSEKAPAITETVSRRRVCVLLATAALAVAVSATGASAGQKGTKTMKFTNATGAKVRLKSTDGSYWDIEINAKQNVSFQKTLEVWATDPRNPPVYRDSAHHLYTSNGSATIKVNSRNLQIYP
jgi:cytochrome c biogenesis factor